MVSSASSMPVVENGEFVFPEASGNITVDQIANIIKKSTPTSLEISSDATGILLEAKVAENTPFTIQYSCDMANWKTIISAVGEEEAVSFSVDSADLDSSCAFFRIVESN